MADPRDHTKAGGPIHPEQEGVIAQQTADAYRPENDEARRQAAEKMKQDAEEAQARHARSRASFPTRCSRPRSAY